MKYPCNVPAYNTVKKKSSYTYHELSVYLIRCFCQLSSCGVKSLILEGNTKWIGSGGGLIFYDGSNFKKMDASNSRLPDNYIYTMAIDKKGNKWIGTINGGIAVYKEGGVKTNVDSLGNSDLFVRIYPNPIKSSASISYFLPEKSHITIGIYNPGGHLQETIQNKMVEKGHYTLA